MKDWFFHQEEDDVQADWPVFEEEDGRDDWAFDECEPEADEDGFEELLHENQVARFPFFEDPSGEEDIRPEDAGDDLQGFQELQIEEATEKHTQDVTSMELPMDWENLYDTDDSVAGVRAESIPDGLIKCLNTKGCVDIEYIAAITGAEYREVIERLKGSIYQNPDTWGECFYMGWEMADEYLSGNIRRKLEIAKAENANYHGYFSANVEALEKLLAPALKASEIYITLGSPWVPGEVIMDFIVENSTDSDFFERYKRYLRYSEIRHDAVTGSWEITMMRNMRIICSSFASKYGCAKRFKGKGWDGLDILFRTLNQRSVAVYDEVKSEHTKSGVQKVINKECTVDAMEKQKQMISDFQQWVWQDPDRFKLLRGIYEEKYGSIRQRHFDGSFLEFPGMAQDVSLFPYQKNAVARILYTPNTLLAHDVGSGKTYIMIAAGMEMRRQGLCKKILYVVPNNILGQWEHFFYEMYPGAEVLLVTPGSFTPKKRQATLEAIQKADVDAILMPYSCFSMIPVSKAAQEDALRREIKSCEDIRDGGANKNTKGLERRIKDLKKKLAKLITEKEETGICFDALGIDRLFVDEAHNFKNVPIDTKTENVLGISKTGSSKCKDMMEKVRIVQHRNGGKGVVFATGTPITNSVTDAFIMQSYLQGGELAALELQNFDSWIGMFAEPHTEFEVDVDTSAYRLATRFSRFHNIPELTTMLAAFADFHSMEGSQGVPVHNGYRDIVLQKTPEFQAYLKQISERADLVRRGGVSRTTDNMLLITTDGRKAALDLRLVEEDAAFARESKVWHCAEEVARIYHGTMAQKSTQLVFCDTSTPKEDFNVYDELKRLLLARGIPEKEIAYIHSAGTDKQREALFAKVRQGVVRILIGSTFKLGLGVNVQDKLIALHHLDVPWRPADMVQREGRILRQGNENKEVQLFRYITEGSFDAYSWQLLETKQRFISDLLSGMAAERSSEDVDDTVLKYAEVKALAVGNPLVKQRVEAANELARYQILQRKIRQKMEEYRAELDKIPPRESDLQELIVKCDEDRAFYQANRREYEAEERKDFRELAFAAAHPEEPTRQEQIIAEYQGFQVILPAHATKDNPVLCLRRSGNYVVYVGKSDVGLLVRIDNCLEELDKRLETLREELERLRQRRAFLEKELAAPEDYADQILNYQKRLVELDEQLGVNEEG